MQLPAKKWIWEHDDYGTFPYDKKELEPLIAEILLHKTKMDGILAPLSEKVVYEVEVEKATDEIYDNSRIEGIYLNRESIRNSVAKKIHTRYANLHNTSTRHTDALVKLLMEVRSSSTPVTEKTLQKWHKAIFSHSEGLVPADKEIKIGQFRDEPVNVIEDTFSRTKSIKYVAPPPETLQGDIEKFLDYCNHGVDEPCIKAAIAHLWFVSIHPYDDGNGRMSRAIADHILSHDSEEGYKAYSISTAIFADRDGYFEALGETTNLYKNRHFDFTPWIAWHLNVLLNAIKKSLHDVEFIIQRASFWEKNENTRLNEREMHIINRMMDKMAEGKAPVISSKEYRETAKTTHSTAGRDIRELIKSNILKRVAGSGGRNVRYSLSLEKENELRAHLGKPLVGVLEQKAKELDMKRIQGKFGQSHAIPSLLGNEEKRTGSDPLKGKEAPQSGIRSLLEEDAQPWNGADTSSSLDGKNGRK